MNSTIERNGILWKKLNGTKSEVFISEYGDCMVLLGGESYRVYANNGSGYKLFSLVMVDGCRKSFSCHRLVATLFIIDKYKGSKKRYVNHIDGDLSNNHYSNLEWCTPSENIFHAQYNRKNKTKYSIKQLKEMGRMSHLKENI